MSDYNKKIKRLIKESGINQEVIAQKIEMTPQNLSQHLQKPYPPLETIEKICNALNLEVYEFFADDETRHKIKMINTPFDEFDKNLWYDFQVKLNENERLELLGIIRKFVALIVARSNVSKDL